MKYIVNNGETNLGPFSFPEICDMIKAAKLKTTHQIYLYEEDRWVTIQQHPEFIKYNLANNKPFKVELPPPPPIKKKAEAEIKTETKTESIEWYILKGGERKGPHAFVEIVKMLQDKTAFEYDYIWKQGLANWTRIAEVPEFSHENVRRLMKAEATKKHDLFFRRKCPRISYECPIIAHDNKTFWSGYTIDIGEDGAGIVVENSMIMPGQNIYLHFKAGPHTKAFNVLCEVVSKRYIKNVKNAFTPMVYGIKFINIPKQEKDIIKALSDVAVA